MGHAPSSRPTRTLASGGFSICAACVHSGCGSQRRHVLRRALTHAIGKRCYDALVRGAMATHDNETQAVAQVSDFSGQSP